MAKPERHPVDPVSEADDLDIFDTPEDPAVDAARDAEAEADVAAGRCVPHAEVARWLDAWAKDPTLPMPEAWLK